LISLDFERLLPFCCPRTVNAGRPRANDIEGLAPVSGNEVEERAGLLATQFAVEHNSWLYALDQTTTSRSSSA
jgi:hypothetical protein